MKLTLKLMAAAIIASLFTIASPATSANALPGCTDVWPPRPCGPDPIVVCFPGEKCPPIVYDNPYIRKPR